MASATRFTWTPKAADDEVTADDINDLAAAIQDLYDVVNVAHDPSDGSHDDPLVPKGIAYVKEDGSGGYTLEYSDGNVASITDNGTGDVTVNFTNNMADDGSGNYEYVVIPSLVGEDGMIKVGTRAAGSVQVLMYDKDGNAADRSFCIVFYGDLA